MNYEALYEYEFSREISDFEDCGFEFLTREITTGVGEGRSHIEYFLTIGDYVYLSYIVVIDVKNSWKTYYRTKAGTDFLIAIRHFENKKIFNFKKGS